jgi:tRNA modification GTPase
VADETGTTRDWLEARLDAGAGPACVLVDLAGVPAGEAGDAIEGAAVAAAREQIARADVVVACRDARDPGTDPILPAHVPRIAVLTRCDRSAAAEAVAGCVRTSTVEGTGIDELRSAIHAAVAAVPPRESPATLRLAVGAAAARAAVAAVLPAVRAAAEGGAVDEALVAAQLRRAVDALGEVTGAEIGTDLLDRIFSRHCIGK